MNEITFRLLTRKENTFVQISGKDVKDPPNRSRVKESHRTFKQLDKELVM